MSLVAAMIGLAKLAVRPVWMPYGRRFERVLKHHHKQQPPQLFPSELGGWKDCQPLRYMDCAWNPFCASNYSIESVGVALAPFCCCCKGFEQNLRAL